MDREELYGSKRETFSAGYDEPTVKIAHNNLQPYITLRMIIKIDEEII